MLANLDHSTSVKKCLDNLIFFNSIVTIFLVNT